MTKSLLKARLCERTALTRFKVKFVFYKAELCKRLFSFFTKVLLCKKKVRKFSPKVEFDFVDTSLCYAKFSMTMQNKYSVMLGMISQYDKIYKHEKGFVSMTKISRFDKI